MRFVGLLFTIVQGLLGRREDDIGVRFDKGLFPKKEPALPMRRALWWIILLLVFVISMMRYLANVIRRLGG